jgi:hypothetical protein
MVGAVGIETTIYLENKGVLRCSSVFYVIERKGRESSVPPNCP